MPLAVKWEVFSFVDHLRGGTPYRMPRWFRALVYLAAFFRCS